MISRIRLVQVSPSDIYLSGIDLSLSQGVISALTGISEDLIGSSISLDTGTLVNLSSSPIDSISSILDIGSITSGQVVQLTGVTLVSSTGSISLGSSGDLSSVEISSSTGNILIESSTDLFGIDVSSSQGFLSYTEDSSIVLSLTGVQTLSSLGSISLQRTSQLSDIVLSSNIGNVVAYIGYSSNLIGIQTTLLTGSILNTRSNIVIGSSLVSNTGTLNNLTSRSLLPEEILVEGGGTSYLVDENGDAIVDENGDYLVVIEDTFNPVRSSILLGSEISSEIGNISFTITSVSLILSGSSISSNIGSLSIDGLIYSTKNKIVVLSSKGILVTITGSNKIIVNS